jgi:hypothetical protein
MEDLIMDDFIQEDDTPIPVAPPAEPQVPVIEQSLQEVLGEEDIELEEPEPV